MDHSIPHGSTDQDEITRQCTANSKRSGKRCRKPAMRGRSVCLVHGGKTPRGIASPQFRHGRYSRSLPGQLLQEYEVAQQDPRLLSLRDEIALADATIAQLLQQLDNEPNPAKDRRIWRQIGKQIDLKRRLVDSEVRHMVLAREMIPAEQAMSLVTAIVEIIKRYVPDPSDRHAVAEEITALIDDRNTWGTR
jgi:hypothetical protein